MQGKWSNGNSFHVYYSSKTSYYTYNENCILDVDDTTSYGPETITLKQTSNGSYYYYIHKYAGNGTLLTSEAKITVYRAGSLVATFNVPTNLEEGDYWNVFAIINGQIIPNNTITRSPNTSY